MDKSKSFHFKDSKRILVFISLCILINIGLHAQNKRWEPNWESLKKRDYPQWFSDAKLGIFIHWGVYSVPAFAGLESYGEWFLRWIQTKDSTCTEFMKENYGEQFRYKDFAPLFKAELFNPDEWAELFKKAGAKYVLLVSKHHDGYCLWPSKYAKGWNSMEVGPHRDLVGDLSQSVKSAGLEMGLYYSLPEWNNPLHRWYTDDHRKIGPYVEKHMIPQFKELISRYKPTVLFTDGEWFNTAEEWHAPELISWYFNLVGEKAIVNNRWGSGSNYGFLTPEYSAGINITDRPWAECRGLGRSFALNRNEPLENYLSSKELIHFFAKAVANGGGITLNVGPKADGQIPLLQQERLLQLGEWLSINGEAIYGSSSWIKNGESKEVQVERIDDKIDFNWVRNKADKMLEEDHFQVVWDAYLQADKSGTYKFSAKADDGVRVWIDNKLLIDQWNNPPEFFQRPQFNHGAHKIHEKIRLKAGEKYPLKIAYYENTQNAEIKLYWSNNNQNHIIPAKNFFLSGDQQAKNGIRGHYHSVKQYIAYTHNGNHVYCILMEWPKTMLSIEMPSPNPNMKVALLGSEAAVDWDYHDGKLFIHTEDIDYHQIPSQDAWVFKLENLEQAAYENDKKTR